MYQPTVHRCRCGESVNTAMLSESLKFHFQFHQIQMSEGTATVEGKKQEANRRPASASCSTDSYCHAACVFRSLTNVFSGWRVDVVSVLVQELIQILLYQGILFFSF